MRSIGVLIAISQTDATLTHVGMRLSRIADNPSEVNCSGSVNHQSNTCVSKR